MSKSTETKHRIYVASSWRNEIQPSVVLALREDGHEVYDFRSPAPGDSGFGWRQLDGRPREEWDADYYATTVLDHPVAARAFELDMAALRACSACVLVLPCGRSAHLELGWAVGQGRLSVVYMPKLDEPELMYRMCDYVETTIDGVRRQLSRQRTRPRWQADLADASVGLGMQYEGNLPCNRPVEGKPPCAPYHHRECASCGGCWRHGACTCGPTVSKGEER